jgi:catalase
MTATGFLLITTILAVGMSPPPRLGRGTLGYEPNDQGEWAEQPDFREPPLNLEGAADHWNHREDADYYSQPGALFRLLTPEKRQVLFENTARSVGSAG